MASERIKTFAEFYQFYLTEHRNTTSRVLHFIGTMLVCIFLLVALLWSNYRMLIYTPFLGYGFAWLGHFFFEKNRPATFKYPLWSLASDFKLFYEILTGNQKFRAN